MYNYAGNMVKFPIKAFNELMEVTSTRLAQIRWLRQVGSGFFENRPT
jgi:hypothetical protein